MDPARHISPLTLERHLLAELAPEERAEVEGHLAACGACAARWEALRGVDAAAQDAPDGAPSAWALAAQVDARRRATHAAASASAGDATLLRSAGRLAMVSRVARGWMAAAAALALILGVAISLQEPDRGVVRGEGVQAKGAEGVEMQVFVDRQQGGVLLRDGDAVYPGERLGFAVRAPALGYLLLVGVDDLGEPYLVFPQVPGTQARGLQWSAADFSPLHVAVRLDDRGRGERLYALHCERPRSYEEVASRLRHAAAAGEQRALPRLAGCATDSLALRKPPREVP